MHSCAERPELLLGTSKYGKACIGLFLTPAVNLRAMLL
jgi:hypothetical protein